MKKLIVLFLVLVFTILCLTECEPTPKPPSSQEETSSSLSTTPPEGGSVTEGGLSFFEELLMGGDSEYKLYARLRFEDPGEINLVAFFHILTDMGIAEKINKDRNQDQYKQAAELFRAEVGEPESAWPTFTVIPRETLDLFTEKTLGKKSDSFLLSSNSTTPSIIFVHPWVAYKEMKYYAIMLQSNNEFRGEIQKILSVTVDEKRYYHVFYLLNKYGKDTQYEMTFQKDGEGQFHICSNQRKSAEKEREIPLLKDSNMGLTIEKETEESIRLLMKKISSETSFSVSGHEVSFDDVLEFVAIPQLRPISLRSWNSGLELYSAHDCFTGGRLFVFYGKGRDIEYGAYECLFIKKTLHFKDFDSLKKGEATLEDVETIDPAAKFNFFNPEDPEPNHYVSFLDQGGLNDDYYYYSVHATKDGVVNIGYKKSGDDFIVHEIYKSENLVIDGEIYDPVAAINENDWP